MARRDHLRENAKKDDPYIFDNQQDVELQRVEEQSEALNIVMHGAPVHAPVSSPTKILDIGSGTGHMTTLLGRKFPGATVYGVDPSPTPLQFHEKPDNVQYIQAKLEDLLEAGDSRLEFASFDYVFQRKSNNKMKLQIVPAKPNRFGHCPQSSLPPSALTA